MATKKEIELHRCNKEVELTEMCRDIKEIKNALVGDGFEADGGIIAANRLNSEFRLKAEAQLGLIKWLIPLGLSSTAISILTWVFK